jgi:hypothetical protein
VLKKSGYFVNTATGLRAGDKNLPGTRLPQPLAGLSYLRGIRPIGFGDNAYRWPVHRQRETG